MCEKDIARERHLQSKSDANFGLGRRQREQPNCSRIRLIETQSRQSSHRSECFN